MANRYANLIGSKKISEDFGNINIGFDRVQTDVDAINTELIDQDTRIDNIVSQSGDDITEIVDARYSAPKDITFPVLKDRLDASEEDVVALRADIAKQVEDFRINGESDDTDMLQRAFDFVKEQVLAGKRVGLQFTNGKVYTISAELDFTYHHGCTVTGSAVIRVADSVSSPLSHMVDMRETEVNLFKVGRFTMRDLVLDANGKAEKIIEAWGTNGRGLYYTTFSRCFFYGIKEGGFGIYGVSWQTVFDNCFFLGEGYTLKEKKGIAIRIGNFSNEVVITKCEFNTLRHAVVRDTGSYGKMVITENVFEQIRYSAIKLEGAENVTIKNNYYESVGGEVDTVYVMTSTGISVDACNVIVGSRTTWEQMPVNCTVSENEFANCNAADIIAFDRGYGLEVKRNVISFKSSAHNSLVKLLKYGLGYFNRQSSFGMVIEDNKVVAYDTATQAGRLLVNKIADIGNLAPSSTVDFFTGVTLAKAVIKDVAAVDPSNRKKKIQANLYTSNFVTDAGSTDYFTITKEVISGENVYNFMRTASSAILNYIDIHGSFLERLKGTYVRFSFETANTQSAAGIIFQVTDGVKSLTYLPSGSQTNKTAINSYIPMDFIFYVDPTATRLGFRSNSFCSAGQSVFIKNFSVTPSGYDLSQYVEMV